MALGFRHHFGLARGAVARPRGDVRLAQGLENLGREAGAVIIDSFEALEPALDKLWTA